MIWNYFYYIACKVDRWRKGEREREIIQKIFNEKLLAKNIKIKSFSWLKKRLSISIFYVKFLLILDPNHSDALSVYYPHSMPLFWWILSSVKRSFHAHGIGWMYSNCWMNMMLLILLLRVSFTPSRIHRQFIEF